MFRSVYRQEPILSFAATAGAVNVAIGGLSEHWSLLAVGVGTVGVAIGLRWWQVLSRRSPLKPVTERVASPFVLSPAPDYTPLPTLTMPRKDSRQ